ncbi:MAG: hypothetical protein FWF86_06385 [Clostridia bacterium]|nr:hypothetical protein [Clostridia bacterium]
MAILEHLPTALTSLNRNLGDYTLAYSDEIVANWFYPVTATFDDTGAVLAKFIVARDLSAIYRADDDIEAVLIFGSAQPMLNCETYQYPDDGEMEIVILPLVDVVSGAGLTLAPGGASKLIALLPWEFAHAIQANSSDPAIITVNEAGEIKAVAAGTATLSGTLTVDDGRKEFELEITVAKEGETAEAALEIDEEAVG